MTRSPATDATTGRVCTACGLLCDDVAWQTRGGEVATVEPPCPVATAVLGAPRPRPGFPCRVNGQAAPYEKALDAAAQLLRAARMPLISGLNRATVESARVACEIADRLRGVIAPVGPRGYCRDFSAQQSVGAVTATLGEVAARADLVVSWFADPESSHPRLRERLDNEPRLAADSQGSSRAWLAIDAQDTATTQAADDAWLASADAPSNAANVLRALLADSPVDAKHVHGTTGVTVERWQALVERLRTARYVTFLVDEDSLRCRLTGSAHALATTTLTELAVALHQHTRCVVLPLAGAGNLTGVTQTVLWQTGYPGPVSFAAGYPEFRPHDSEPAELLARGEVGAALIIGADPLGPNSAWPPAAVTALQGIPLVALDDAATASWTAANVAFAARRFETEDAGNVFRTDGVALPLTAAVKSPAPAAAQVLRDLVDRLPR